MPQRKTVVRTLFAALTLSTAATRAQEAVPAPSAPDAAVPTARRASLLEQNTISGSTGLLRLIEPSSGAAGTFRISLLADWFTGKGFLCSAAHPCGTDTRDSANHFGSVLGLSVTPLPYLEAYASLHSFSNSDDEHSPGLLNVVGNTTLGAKLFSAEPVAGPLSFGANAELQLLNGAGSVGFDGKSTSFRLTALGGLDFRRLEAPLPLRLTANLGYLLDNSGALIEGVEQSRQAPITRVERFGLDINRVDRVQTGIGSKASLASLGRLWNGTSRCRSIASTTRVRSALATRATTVCTTIARPPSSRPSSR